MMRLYLVRWPNLSAALVYAHDEEELGTMLDGIADPHSCTFVRVTEPLHVELHFKDGGGDALMGAAAAAAITASVDDGGLQLEASLPDTDASAAFDRWAIGRLFPRAAAVDDALRADGAYERGLSAEEKTQLQTALKRETFDGPVPAGARGRRVGRCHLCADMEQAVRDGRGAVAHEVARQAGTTCLGPNPTAHGEEEA